MTQSMKNRWHVPFYLWSLRQTGVSNLKQYKNSPREQFSLPVALSHHGRFFRVPTKRFVQVLFFTLPFLVLAVAASGFILPSRQILGLMVDQWGNAKTLTVFQKTVLYSTDLEGGMRELDEILYFKYPDQFRSEVNRPELEKIQVVNAEGALTIVDGKIVGETESLFDHFKDLLLYKDADLLARELTLLGIDLDVVSLGRFKERIAYVIGARYPDESVPQLWVDKETFSPIRVILSCDGESPEKEIVYTEYRALDKKNRYPARILFLEKGTLARMNVLEATEINTRFTNQLFDVVHLKSTYEPIDATPETPSTETELEEVKKGIRDFRKIFE